MIHPNLTIACLNFDSPALKKSRAALLPFKSTVGQFQHARALLYFETRHEKGRRAVKSNNIAMATCGDDRVTIVHLDGKWLQTQVGGRNDNNDNGYGC